MHTKTWLPRRLLKLLHPITKRWQLNSPLRDLALWNLGVNSRGHIACGSTDTVDLLEAHGSPLFVVNEAMLKREVQMVQEAISSASPGSLILYSYKTNCVPGILSRLHELGIGAEVISPYELWLAEQLRVPGHSIVYNGVHKSEESLARAINLGVLSINIDHKEEVEKIHGIAKRLNRKANVGIRLSMSESTQFGLEIPNDEAMNVAKSVLQLSDYLDLKCIHFHATTNERYCSTHKQYTIRALRFASRLKKETGVEISYLDIGGGMGPATSKKMSFLEHGLYRGFDFMPKPPMPTHYQPITSYLKEILASIESFCRANDLGIPKLVVEPGRLITSRAEFLLATVHSIKQKVSGSSFAITDAGRLTITYPCTFEYHEVFLANRPQATPNTFYHVMGQACTSGDWMLKNRYLPGLKAGDVLAVMDAGAYFTSFSSTFAFPRPAIVVVSDDGVNTIRDEETFEHLVATDSY